MILGKAARLSIAVLVSVTLAVPMVQALPSPVWAAPLARPVLIGALTTSWGPTPHMVGLREGLAALGYEEERDYVLGIWFTRGEVDSLLEAAQDLVAAGAQILFCVSDKVTEAAVTAADGRAVVFADVGDPVGMGLIASYDRPGGNVTGVADQNLQLSGKRLQVFQQLVPELRRVWVPYVADSEYQSRKVARYREAAQRLGLELVALPLRSRDEAWRRLVEGIEPRAGDGLVSPRTADLNIPGFVLDAATRHRLPAMFSGEFYPTHGGLASYGPTMHRSGLLAARLVAKIMEGESPAEIPVEVNNDIQFVINLPTAADLGIEVPRRALYQANRLIR